MEFLGFDPVPSQSLDLESPPPSLCACSNAPNPSLSYEQLGFIAIDLNASQDPNE